MDSIWNIGRRTFLKNVLSLQITRTDKWMFLKIKVSDSIKLKKCKTKNF